LRVSDGLYEFGKFRQFTELLREYGNPILGVNVDRTPTRPNAPAKCLQSYQPGCNR
jgi:hypothetical protein